jgi:hypothetical protein
MSKTNTTNKIGLNSIASEKITVGIPAVSGEGAFGVNTISIPKLSIGDSGLTQELRDTINDQAEVIKTTKQKMLKIQRELKEIGTALNDLKQCIREEGMHVTFSNTDLIDIVDDDA